MATSVITPVRAGPRPAVSPPVPASPESSANSVITVLTSVALPEKLGGTRLMHKTFSIDEAGKLQIVPYQKAKRFNSVAVPVKGINDLGKLIATISADPRKIVIRGLHQSPKSVRVQRLKDDFPEHKLGTSWVMIDFDDIELPNDTDPLSLAAIEHCIAKLPHEFQGVTYYYQHSNSAGILKLGGKPLKAGLNAHVFFWLSRRIPGDELATHLKSHCINTGFYEVGPDKGNNVRIKYGIDPSVITSSIQAHYTAAPEIGEGVKCQLDPVHRQGLVIKAQAEVQMPTLSPSLGRDVARLQSSLTDNFKREHGFKSVISQTKTGNGVSTVHHLVNPNADLRGGRTFTHGKLSRDEKFFTPYFAEENSPGSYYVVKDRPEFAYRYGGDRMLLKDLSAGAHAYVRDELRWFTEIAHHDLQLEANGYLPALSSFAHAKASLILAPTGSGKTKAAIDWMQLKLGPKTLVVYAAPTIALVKQMCADLQARGVTHQSYTETWAHALPSHGVIVTTNTSMRRILELIYDAANTSHYLIVDEIHTSLDEFMKSKPRNVAFEIGMVKAKQTLLLTGTMTKVQRTKLVSTVGHALSGLSETNYCGYEFACVKRNPLTIRPSANFDSDFMEMVKQQAELSKSGQTLRRVVVLLDTSKLQKYRAILDEYGLTPFAHVVSRPENQPEAIDAARVGREPILIASPLFALGMNFDAEPEILWAKFDHIKADTNQINQAINRANRGQVRCDVRIYGNVNDEARIRMPNSGKLKDEVKALLTAESSFEGLLEEHFQIDPATYTILRQAEKHSQASLSQLVRDKGFQNFELVSEPAEPQIDKGSAAEFKAHGKAARQYYSDAISTQATHYVEAEDYVRFLKMEQISIERGNWRSQHQRIELEISNEELGVLMSLCNMTDPKQIQKVKAVKIKRLFGEISPWISVQYSRETHSDWAKVEAEKTDKLVVLVNKLNEVQSGTLTPKGLAQSLTRNAGFSEGFLALASNDNDYLVLSQKFESLRKARNRAREKGSDAEKSKVLKAGFELLAEVLEPLGVVFARKMHGNKKVIDYDTLIVPATWNLGAMAVKLESQAQRLRALPVDQKMTMLNSEAFEGEVPVSMEVCRRCIFMNENSCAQGHPVAWQGDAFELKVAQSCASFKALKLKLVTQ